MQNETLTYLLRRGFIGYFVFETLDKDRNAYNGISRQEFIDTFEVSEAMVYAFQDYLNLRKESKITFVAYHDEVKQYIKATLADQLYGNGALEEVLNQQDIMIEEVIALSKKN
jgi:carboxyl-terminal processing protease